MPHATPSRRPPVVLVANTEEWSTRSVESVIASEGYHVVRAHTGQQVFEYAESAQPDAVLLNVSLPDLPGISVCRELRARSLVAPSTPILMISGSLPEQSALVEALRAGAWDLMALPLDSEVLVAKLGAYVGAKLDAEGARESSLLDAATGLYNLKGILRQVAQLGQDAARHGRPIACVVFAADPGADRAREVGAALADRVRASTRGSDAVGRLSRNEFIVVAPETGREGVLKLAERLAQAITAAESAAAAPGLHIRAGCYAVGDMEEEALQPTDLLVRATVALRQSQADTSGATIRFYDDTDLTSTSLS